MTEAIDLCELMERFGDEQSCRYQFSVTADTQFHDTHLPLFKWFLATFLICQSRKGMSANQLKRMLRINYRTAWYLCHRIRDAMQATDRQPLGGIVEVDETFVGGQSAQSWTSSMQEQVVIGIRQRGGELRFFHASDVKSGTLAKYIKENISQDVDVIMTDEAGGYPSAIAKAGVLAERKTVKHKDGIYVDSDVYTNTVESAFSLLKRGIVGTWHKVSAKHLQAYLHEWSFASIIGKTFIYSATRCLNS